MKERVKKVPIRLVFESALELMGTTQIGTFQVSPCAASVEALCVHPDQQKAQLPA